MSPISTYPLDIRWFDGRQVHQSRLMGMVNKISLVTQSILGVDSGWNLSRTGASYRLRSDYMMDRLHGKDFLL